MQPVLCLVSLLPCVTTVDHAELIESGVRHAVQVYVDECDSMPKMCLTALAWQESDRNTRVATALHLLTHLSSRDKRKVTNQDDFYVPRRFMTGESWPKGHGMTVYQDVFTKGGRAAWAIELILDKRLPDLYEGLEQKEYDKRVKEICKIVGEWCDTQNGVRRK